MKSIQQVTTGKWLVSMKIGVSEVVVCLLISDWCISLFEQDFIWAQRLLGAFGIFEVPNEPGLRDSSFDEVSLDRGIGRL